MSYRSVIASCIAALALNALSANVSAQSSSADKLPIAIKDLRLDTVVEVGQTAVTECFEFKVNVRSRITDTGCRVRAYVMGKSGAMREHYFAAETASAAAGPVTLDAQSKVVLEGLRQQTAQTQPRSAKPTGTYDTNEGKYLGGAKAKIAGRDAIFMRWGLELAKGVKSIEIGCPPPDALSASSEFNPYSAVTARFLVSLPEGRYLWKGERHVLLVAKGLQKDCISPYFNYAVSTLRFR
jgi:hypothetical protein